MFRRTYRPAFILFCFFLLIHLPKSHGQQNKKESAFISSSTDSFLLFSNPAKSNVNQPGIESGFFKSSKSHQTRNTYTDINNRFESNFVTCFDTSLRTAIGKDSITFYAGQSIKARDGSILIPGEFVQYVNQDLKSGGFLIKADDRGNVLWAKFYDSTNAGIYHWLNYYKVIELRDGSLLLGGAGNEPVSGNSDVVFTKTDASGNIIWTKEYFSRLWTMGSGSADYFYIHQLEQDIQSDDIFISGPTWAKGIAFMRMNTTTGNMVWSNAYMLNSNGYVNDQIAGMVVRPNELVALGTYALYNSHILIYRLNKANGDTLSTKMLKLLDTPYYKLGMITPGPATVLDNGDVALSGLLGGYYQYQYNGTNPLHQAGVVTLDSNFNFRQAFAFRNNIESNGYNSKVTMYPDGSGVFNMLQVISGFTGTEFIIQFKNGKILKERIRSFSNQGYPSEKQYIRLPEGGDLTVKLVGDSITNANKIVLSKIHLSDTSSQCMGLNAQLSSTSPFSYTYQGHVYADSIKRSIFLERKQRQVVATTFNVDPPVSLCRQFSFCDTISLSSAMDTICTNVPITFKVYKNKECGSRVAFMLNDPNIANIITVNDSTYQVTFLSAWQGYLYGSISSCNTITDSLYFTVYANPAPLNLGPDFSICPGTSDTLMAQPGYVYYEWQDGSIQQQLIVNAPGIYHVKVRDACNNILRDTVIIGSLTTPVFSLGNDTTLCENQTLLLNPAVSNGTYLWSNGSTQTSQTITQPGSYWLTVTSQQGCKKTDSILVSYVTAQQVNLGADTSLCEGSSLNLQVNFPGAQYLWSTGHTGSSVNLNQSGTYWLSVNNGSCVMKDTITVTFNAPPVFSLRNDTTLCVGNILQLSLNIPGAQYIWQDGSTASSISIIAPALYWVQVNKGGCVVRDSINVQYFTDTPFSLGPDIRFCQGGNATLIAPSGFMTYSWNNGSTGNNIMVSQPGTYWASAINNNGCLKRDTLLVFPPFDLPNITLGPDTDICAGTSKNLSTGIAGASYAWNTGQSTPLINVTNTGTYWVSVTDQNGCLNSDTIQIRNILPNPSGFLYSDTSICRYQNFTLTPQGLFNDYTWNTGQHTAGLTITQAGHYWLQVTDANNCKGIDSIMISEKDCLLGLYVPTAFTPNGDTRNDHLRAMLFGDIQFFEFNVFNVYGQLVFSTKDPLKGWDGMLKGVRQETANFVWICRYRINGKGEKIEKGSSILIR